MTIDDDIPKRGADGAPGKNNDPGSSLGDDLDMDSLGDNFGDDDPGFIDEFDKEAPKTGIIGTIQNNPLAKVGVVLASAALLIGIVIYMGMSPKRPDQSYLPSGSDITQAPGTAEVSQNIREAYEEVNQAMVEEAERKGGSAIPIQIDPPSAALAIPDDGQPDEDPLQRWRRLQEERLQKELERTEIVEPSPPVNQGPDPAIGALADAMSQQMQSILERHGKNNFGYKLVADQAYIDGILQPGAGEGGGDLEGGGGDDDDDDSVVYENVLLPAGEILYGQLLTEANSDVQGPVLALIASGPLQGAKLIGGFDVQDELISLIFDRMVYKKKTIMVDAIALNPNTTLPGLATDVDHRYFKRIVLPAAAAFIEGAADAISNSGLTTVTITGETVATDTNDAGTREEIASGVEEAGKEVGSILSDMASNTKVLVRIRPGTPIGILFMEEVVDDEG